MTQSDSQRSRQPDGGGGGSKKLAFAVAVLTLLTAGFGVLSGYLGFQTAQLSEQQKEAEVNAASSGARASALQVENGDLQQQNNSLRSQLGAPTASTEPGVQPSVRHAGKFVLAVGGTGADLDASPSDKLWGTNGGPGINDLGFSGETIGVSDHDLYLRLDSEKADYDSCSARTDYVSVSSFNGIAAKDYPAGTYMCVKTAEHRYSAVRVLAIDNSKVTFDVVTYDPPFK